MFSTDLNSGKETGHYVQVFFNFQIIHWIANEIEHDDLFSDCSDSSSDNNETGKGAVFNDHDGEDIWDPSEVLQCTLEERQDAESELEISEDIVPESSVHLALHCADEERRKDADDSVYRIINGATDTKEYHQAVLVGLCGGWKRVGLDDGDEAIFRSRYNGDWDGTDSIYDSWLIAKGLERDAFSLTKFTEICPRWKALAAER